MIVKEEIIENNSKKCITLGTDLRLIKRCIR